MLETIVHKSPRASIDCWCLGSTPNRSAPLGNCEDNLHPRLHSYRDYSREISVFCSPSFGVSFPRSLDPRAKGKFGVEIRDYWKECSDESHRWRSSFQGNNEFLRGPFRSISFCTSVITCCIQYSSSRICRLTQLIVNSNGSHGYAKMN